MLVVDDLVNISLNKVINQATELFILTSTLAHTCNKIHKTKLKRNQSHCNEEFRRAA